MPVTKETNFSSSCLGIELHVENNTTKSYGNCWGYLTVIVKGVGGEFKLVFRIERGSRSPNTGIKTQFHQQSRPNRLIGFTDVYASDPRLDA